MMITLNNGATVHAAYVLPGGHGMRPNGLVLAENETEWIVWNIYFDPDYNWATDLIGWEAENGSYFQKNMGPDQGDPKRLAECAFGLKLRRLLTEQIVAGVREVR